jgi:hypothetical protein
VFAIFQEGKTKIPLRRGIFSMLKTEVEREKDS